MGHPAALGFLISAIGGQTLQPPLRRTARLSTVTLAAIATRANHEYRGTRAMTALPLPQQLTLDHSRRHAAILPCYGQIPKRRRQDDDRACARMMSSPPGVMFRKLRFKMIANSVACRQRYARCTTS
jgi:hypothetical protein